jgi:D-3-phosphoglycerate dehydrogenase
MKILANDGISQEAKSILEEAGYEVSTNKIPQEELLNELTEKGYDILIVRSATRADEEVLSAPSLKMVARAGVGLDNVDTYTAERRGIKVVNTPGASSQSVAELVMANMFSLSRGLHDSARNMGRSDFNNLKKRYSNGTELRGKRLGIIGFGRIGQALAGYALGIGMDIIAVDIEEKTVEINCKLGNYDVKVEVSVISSIEDALPHCDFVSLHVPKMPNGDSVIGQRELSLMKDSAILINASRGGVVNEDDLLVALKRGNIRAAALDVFENEPNPYSLLLENPDILPTPHIGAATIEAQDRIGIELADAIIREFGRRI